jgi:phenol 2-monooxygenase
MQFHHHGYVSEDPRVCVPDAETHTEEFPQQVDVLVVGTGPAGMITAAQLSQYPGVVTRIIEVRDGRLELGHADGIAVRSVETFDAFGFAEEIMHESYQITQTAFWHPNPASPAEIMRTAYVADDPAGRSEYPHIVCNQARVQDYFATFMAKSPRRMTPDYGIEFVGLSIGEGEYPVTVDLRRSAGPNAGEEFQVQAKYVVGCDSAKSKVRKAIGRHLVGDSSAHAWGVMDVLVETDFPDFRLKTAIQSTAGSILWIPREGGYLTRVYVDLGVTAADDNGKIRETTQEQTLEIANRIFHPYHFEVRDTAWYSVYEVGHRVTDKFDDVPFEEVGHRTPRVFIAGDACHTHSAKAAQGMNVSMQDGWNIAWKLGAVLSGQSPESILDSYSAERQPIAQNLIDYDKAWAKLMASAPTDADTSVLTEYYSRGGDFTAGLLTQYPESALIGAAAHQELAAGYPVGKRFYSYPVTRVCDATDHQLGHLHTADGRWRVYVFADATGQGAKDWAQQIEATLARFTPTDAQPGAVFDVKVIYQGDFTSVDLLAQHAVFRPAAGPFGLTNWEQVFATNDESDIFAARQISRDGAVVVVRPDQYVAQVLPLGATDELSDYFAGVMLPQR